MVHPRCNTLLAQLPDADFEHLLPHLQLISLSAGDRLYNAGDPIGKIHFPVTALIALTRELSDGTRIDTALLGSDEMLGLRGLLGDSSMHSVHVAASGLAYQLPLSVIQQAIASRHAVYRMCMQGGNDILNHISVETACAHFHCTEQRLARWLLTRQDLLGSSHIEATHKRIAESLGVRREAITLACRKLGGIESRHGQIELLDRTPLEQMSCDCYFRQRENRTARKKPSAATLATSLR